MTCFALGVIVYLLLQKELHWSLWVDHSPRGRGEGSGVMLEQPVPYLTVGHAGLLLQESQLCFLGTYPVFGFLDPLGVDLGSVQRLQDTCGIGLSCSSQVEGNLSRDPYCNLNHN